MKKETYYPLLFDHLHFQWQEYYEDSPVPVLVMADMPTKVEFRKQVNKMALKRYSFFWKNLIRNDVQSCEKSRLIIFKQHEATTTGNYLASC